MGVAGAGLLPLGLSRRAAGAVACGEAQAIEPPFSSSGGVDMGPLTQDLNRILHSETSDASRIAKLASSQTAFTRANDTGHALTHEVQARRSRDTRSGSPSRAGTPVEATGGAPTPASAWDPPDHRFQTRARATFLFFF